MQKELSTGNFSFIQELDEEQRTAATAEENAVVSAGAGSGKTRVLTARYGWLIMTGRCKAEEILAITFTNKAANEMYRRIYSLLAEYAPHNEYARTAIKDFHKARICTLDSFCMTIARTVCRRFGISPDFESDEAKAGEIARSLALRFVLDKRNNPALQQLIAEKKMRLVAEELFVEPVLYHSPLSRPLDFKRFETIQQEEIQNRWKEYTGQAEDQIALIQETRSGIDPEKSLAGHLSAALSCTVKAPCIKTLFADPQNNLREKTAAYITFLAELTSFVFRGRISGAALIIKEAMTGLKELYEKLLALANHALQWNIVTAIFPLIDEYQTQLNKKKREAGILTFTDIAHLAVDGLRLYSGIRRMYQDMFRMIMIDEFQDNNSLQRDLIDLLASPAKVFYVGDEKQSIYRFRGADVSVFRSLAEEAESKLSLNHNYRSRPALIGAFNQIFGGYRGEDNSGSAQGVFPPEGDSTAHYEAVYRKTKSKKEEAVETGSIQEPRLHFAFFDNGSLDGELDSDQLDKNNPIDASLKAEDYEALYIAEKITKLVSQKKLIQDNGGERPCTYGDFAVLQRSHTRQRALEKAFKLFGIPFSAGRPAALFADAPVNDLWAFLKLLLYPDDRIAYGALLRSPFVRLSEDAFTLCMLEASGKPEVYGGTAIFDESIDEKLSAPDRRRYQEARRLYRELLHDARNLPVSALITKLWYKYGYRYEALWSAASQVYLNLYDLFFEQARTIEERGKGLVDFLDYLEDLASKKERPDDSVLPDEEESGVRIMTIHRCKGLEFPIVFVYGCGSREDASLDRGLTFFSERWGIVLQLPLAEELNEADDYFLLAEKDEHRAKTLAELRRLLYVAMTRAEEELYVTAVIPAQNKAEAENLNPEDFNDKNEFIEKRFEQYRTNPGIQSFSFLRLLPALNKENPLYTIEAIKCKPPLVPMYKSAQGMSMEQEVLKIKPDYKNIPVVPLARFVPQTINASSFLEEQAAPAAGLPSRLPSIDGKFNGELRFDDDALDELLAKTGLEPRDFGSVVHSFIEDRFNSRSPRIPFRIASNITDSKLLDALDHAARTMADGFFNSPLGRKALDSSFLKTEYPVLTVINHGKDTQEKITVLGKMDLIFDDGDTMYVVDFKTDKEEDVARHAGQLAVYKQAAEDIFGKPVKCCLFYLRSCQEVELGKDMVYQKSVNGQANQ